MKPKSFAALAAVTAVALLAAGAAVNRDTGTEAVAGIGDPALPGLLARVNDVARMEITHAKGVITIIGGDTGWTVKESDGYPARTIKVKRAILGLARLTQADPKTRMKEKYAKLDLEDPGTEGSNVKHVKLYDGTGAQLAELLVGRRRAQMPGTTSGGVYVRRPGDAQAWLAAGDTDLSDEKREWLERLIADIDDKRVKRVVIAHPDGETVTVSKGAPGEGNFTLEALPAGKKLISVGGPNAIGRGLSQLMLDDARKDARTFDAAGSVRARFVTFDGLTVTARVAKRADGNHWLRIEARSDDGKADADAINARTAGWTYRISDYAVSNLNKRMDVLVEDKKPGS